MQDESVELCFIFIMHIVCSLVPMLSSTHPLMAALLSLV